MVASKRLISIGTHSATFTDFSDLKILWKIAAQLLKVFPLTILGLWLLWSSDESNLQYNPDTPSSTYWHSFIVWVYIFVNIADEMFTIINGGGFDEHLHHVATTFGMFFFLSFPHLTARAAFMIGINEIVSPVFSIFHFRKHSNIMSNILSESISRFCWKCFGFVCLFIRFFWNSIFAYRSFVDVLIFHEKFNWGYFGRFAAILGVVLSVMLTYLDVTWMKWLYRYMPKGSHEESTSCQMTRFLVLFPVLCSMIFMRNSSVFGSSTCPHGYDRLENFSKKGLRRGYYMGVPWALPKTATFLDGVYATLSISKIFLQSDSKCVKISDARDQTTEFERNGFTLEQITDDYNWEDPEDIKSYVSDVQEMLKKRFPEAKAIECVSPIIRGPNANSPIRSVHFDYWSDLEEAKQFGSETVADFLELLESNNSTEGMILGVWKPIRYAVEDDFLALLDVQSFNHEEAFKVYYDYPALDEDGFQYQLRSIGGSVPYHSNQNWFYFSNMTPNEALIFTQFDSTSFHPKINAHTAVSRGLNKRPRQSVELRASIIM